MAQRIYHWKHGWIPLDHYAAVEVTHGRESTKKLTAPPTDALARAKKRQTASLEQHAVHEDQAAALGVKSRKVGGFRLTTVDGYPDVQFKEVLELDKRPPEQYREVAKTASEVLSRYPRAERDPLTIGFSNELMPYTMADTNNEKPHKIRLNPSMWDDPKGIATKMADMRKNHFGLTAEASSLEQFRANVLTHEIGHVLHMRDLDEVLDAPLSKMDQFGTIDAFADEPVTPRQMGYHATAASGGLDGPLSRWQLDSLDRRSAYATSNPYEFFAEAFLDGTVNGDQASESGKRAVKIAGKAFGPGSPSVRDRLYGSDAMKQDDLDALFGRGKS